MKQQTIDKIVEGSKSIKKEAGIKYFQVTPKIYSVILLIEDAIDIIANKERPLSQKYRLIPNDYQIIN